MKYLTTAFLILMVMSTSAQVKLYSYDTKVKTVSVDKIKDKITLDDPNNPFQVAGIGLGLAGVAVSAIVPRVLDGVSTLIYNPKNYIKEYGSNKSFITTQVTMLSNVPDIYYTRYYQDDDKEKIISSFHFKIDAAVGASEYARITLKDFIYRHAQAKLKSNAHTINLSLTPTVVYFKDGEKKTVELSPFLVSNYVPKGNNATQIAIKEPSYQLIPPMDFIERFELKISEVNSKKKHWDAYLKAIYEDNKEGISQVFIDLVPEE